jgi:hypothetical protein
MMLKHCSVCYRIWQRSGISSALQAMDDIRMKEPGIKVSKYFNR